MLLGPGSIPTKGCEFSAIHWEVTIMTWHRGGGGWGFLADILESNS